MKKTLLLLMSFIFLKVTVFAGALRITSPNGGEEWYVGLSRTIHWIATGDFTNNVKLVLFKDGERLGVIANDLNPRARSFVWERAGEYHVGTARGPLKRARPGPGYIIRIKEQNVNNSDESDAPFTLSTIPRASTLDLTVTDVYKDRLDNLIVKVKCLRGSYSGWCLLQAENPNLPRGGFRAKQHMLDLRTGQEQTYTLGAFTPAEWRDIFLADDTICKTAYFKGIVDANDQIDETNEDNNSVHRRVFFMIQDVQIVLPIGIGKFNRDAYCNSEFTIRPNDVVRNVIRSSYKSVELEVAVHVRNCGKTPLRGGRLRFEQYVITETPPRGIRRNAGPREIDTDTINVGEIRVDVEPGHVETYRPNLYLLYQRVGNADPVITTNELNITLLPADAGTHDINNHCNKISLKFEGF
jgi:hypothetical protein